MRKGILQFLLLFVASLAMGQGGHITQGVCETNVSMGSAAKTGQILSPFMIEPGGEGYGAIPGLGVSY